MFDLHWFLGFWVTQIRNILAHLLLTESLA